MIRRPSGFVLAYVLALGAGCSPNPFCLNCGVTDGGGGGLTDAANDTGTGMGPPDQGPLDGACGDGLQSTCRGVDPQCVDPKLLSLDPKNCGACGHECTFPNAAGLCMKAICSMGPCQPGYYDLDHAVGNGCEYACSPAPPAKCAKSADCSWGLPCSNGFCLQPCKTDADCPNTTSCDPNTKLCEGELCDGLDNNCNGKIDESFDLKNDVSNCGTCRNVCAFPNATGKCGNGACTLFGCKPAYYDLNKNGQDGCEYFCHYDKPAGDGGVIQVAIDPPSPELCNGLDDDCDGVIDNNPNDVGKPCDDYCPMQAACVGQKNCVAPLSACSGKCCGICTEGATVCAGGQKVCQMGMGPKLEVCNGQDDNCDGQVDEGFDLASDPVNCGMCGNDCGAKLANAIAGCKAGSCTIVVCKNGYADVDKNPMNGCEYMCPVNPRTIETCNGLDDDCNGVVDDNLIVPNNFCTQTSICMGSKPVCCGMTGWLCNYDSVNPKIEVTKGTMCQGGQLGGNLAFSEMLCDGVDGNCNGQVDESFPNLGKVCYVGIGLCAGKASFICDPKNAAQMICPTSANAGAATDELCNGIDDDCDGLVDERTDGPGMCAGGGMHVCKGWRDLTVQVGSQWLYQYEASRIDATAMAVGGSSARACSQSGVLPWSPVTQTAAAAACAAVKDSMGVPLHLCAVADWQTACNIGTLPPAQIWSFSANPTTYVGSTCNGADNQLAKSWTTGSGATCYAKNTNGNIFDLSGNVAEWTSTPVVYNNTTYYKIRGGGYSTPAGGMSCNFDFVIEQANYQYNDIGFRCCADNAP